jgi:uncharacterized SAM-binding protein YcdF (DUF218 family)
VTHGWIGFGRSLLRSLSVVLVGSVTLYLLTVAYVFAAFHGDAVFPADCAVVFGTAVHPVRSPHGDIVYTGPGPGILRRVSTAAALYRSGKVKRVFFTGGTGDGMAESEAEVMRRLAVVEGVAYADIMVETQSHSTRENLAFTRPLMQGCTTAVGVSDVYHLARIKVLSRLMGWKLGTYPAAERPDLPFELQSVLREGIGIWAAIGGAVIGIRG